MAERERIINDIKSRHRNRIDALGALDNNNVIKNNNNINNNNNNSINNNINGGDALQGRTDRKGAGVNRLRPNSKPRERPLHQKLPKGEIGIAPAIGLPEHELSRVEELRQQLRAKALGIDTQQETFEQAKARDSRQRAEAGRSRGRDALLRASRNTTNAIDDGWIPIMLGELTEMVCHGDCASFLRIHTADHFQIGFVHTRSYRVTAKLCCAASRSTSTH